MFVMSHQACFYLIKNHIFYVNILWNELISESRDFPAQETFIILLVLNIFVETLMHYHSEIKKFKYKLMLLFIKDAEIAQKRP